VKAAAVVLAAFPVVCALGLAVVAGGESTTSDSNDIGMCQTTGPVPGR
jgi:hypothetical protein